MISLRKPQFVRWLEKNDGPIYEYKIRYGSSALEYTTRHHNIEYVYKMLLDSGVIVEKVVNCRTFSGHPTDVLGYSVHVPITATKPPILWDSELTKRIMQSDSNIVQAKETEEGLVLESYCFCRFINKEQMPYYAVKRSILQKEYNRDRELPLEVYQLQP